MRTRFFELISLCGFAFAQPVFDLLGQNPEFLVAHRLHGTGLFFLAATLFLAGLTWFYAYLAGLIDPGRSYTLLESLGGVTLSGSVLFLIAAQGVQLLLQAGLVLRHAGQVYIFKYLTVQEARPDPELTSPDPYSPFIPDRPYTGPDDKTVQPGLEEDTQHA